MTIAFTLVGNISLKYIYASNVGSISDVIDEMYAGNVSFNFALSESARNFNVSTSQLPLTLRCF